MARSRRIPAPPLAVTRSAAPAVNLVLGYAAPELAAWASAHREAVLRAAEAVETAYMAAVDELAPRLPGGVGAWERARGSVRFYDSEREEHLARPPTTVENVEGWQSRATDPNGYRSVVALLPVRALNVANRWVHGFGFGGANGSAWTMTRLAPSPETPLELASYDIRRMGVDVTQRTGEDGGGGSTMPTLTLILSGMYDVKDEPIRVRKEEKRTWSATRGSYLLTTWRAYDKADPSRMIAKAESLALLRKRLARYLSDRDSGTLGQMGRYVGGEDLRPAPLVGTPRVGVDVTQRAGEDGGGGSTMPNLDAAHNALLQVLRLAPRHPLAAERLDFGPVAMRHYMSRAGLPNELTNAVVHRDIPGIVSPPRFVHPSQIKTVREVLVSEGVVVPVETDSYGRVRSWGFAPVEKFATQEAYNSALAAIRGRVGA